MKQLLKRIGLTENFTIEMAVDRADFVKVLNANVDPPGVELFESLFKSKNAYKGTVSHDSFELRRRRKFFEQHGSNRVTINGRLRQRIGNVEVDLELTAFNMMLVPLVVIGLLVYSGFIVSIFTGWSPGGGDTVSIWAVPFVFVHAGLMFGLPYFFLRRCLRAAKYDIERDLFFMMKEKIVGKQSAV